MNATYAERASPVLSVAAGSARAARRPGNGWKWLGSSVWEHPSGTRIHGLGRVRFADGTGRMWTWQEEYHFRRLMGYNTKRALMAWALSLLPPNNKFSNAVNGPRSQTGSRNGVAL